MYPRAFFLAGAPLPPFIHLQGVLMVLMNLGVLALPIIQLGGFLVDPVRILLQACGILRREVSTALVGEPAEAPADPEVAISQVLCLHIYCSSILYALQLPPD